MITQRMIQRAMPRACKAARLRVRNPHDLRHTYATLLLMDHYSPAYVQKQLGHSSISITVDIYGHWIPGEGKKDLKSTLRGPKARPGQIPLLVKRRRSEYERDKLSPMAPVGIIMGNGFLTGVTGDEIGDRIGAEGQNKRRNPLRLRLN